MYPHGFRFKKYHYVVLKNPNCFFEPVLISTIRQKLFNRGQFGLTPVKDIFHPLSFGHKIPLAYIY